MAKYFLTRHALSNLDYIYEYSLATWGAETADQYLKDLYDSFKTIAKSPQQGEVRRFRSYPFLMTAVRKHFIVYNTAEDGVIILTVLHQMQNIEGILADLEPSILEDLQRLKRKF